MNWTVAPGTRCPFRLVQDPVGGCRYPHSTSDSSEPPLFDSTGLRTSRTGAKRKKIANPIDDAREFGGYTGHKLDLLDLYLKGYRRVAGNGTYLDGFAGTGQVKIDGKLRPGSASIAIEAKAFQDMYFYEKEGPSKDLERYLAYHYTVKRRQKMHLRVGDFNQLVLQDLADETFPRSRPLFAMLDPNSTELEWSTIEALAAYKNFEPGPKPDHPKQCKAELWILLNTHQVLLRLVKDHPGTIDKVMGGRKAWGDLIDKDNKVAGNLLAGRYAENLMGLGYVGARAQRIRDPQNGRTAYFMIHASDHPAAHSFMRWSEREQSGDRGEQIKMFPRPPMKARSERD